MCKRKDRNKCFMLCGPDEEEVYRIVFPKDYDKAKDNKKDNEDDKNEF